MREFNLSTKCPKCRFNGDIKFHWHGSASRFRLKRILEEVLDLVAVPIGAPLRESKEEHIARRCPKCNYGWGELPADTPSPLHQLALQAD